MMVFLLTTQTLTVFLGNVLSKKYTNPSSDIIEVLAGLDDVDSVFTELVTTLDVAMKSGRTSKSVSTAKLTSSELFSPGTAKGCPTCSVCSIRGLSNGSAHVLYATRSISSNHEGMAATSIFGILALIS